MAKHGILEQVTAFDENKIR